VSQDKKGETDDAGAQFVDAVRRYNEAQQEIASEAQRRAQEAAEGFARATQEVHQQQFAGSGYGAGTSVHEAIRAYPNAVAEAQQRWQELLKDYEEALRTASEEIAQRQVEEFRTYVAHLQGAWAQLDPATIDPSDIAAIQQAMAAAACTPAGKAA